MELGLLNLYDNPLHEKFNSKDRVGLECLGLFRIV